MGSTYILDCAGDLVGPVKAVQKLMQKRVVVAFPPARSSFALKQAAKATLHVGRVELAKSQFPLEVKRKDGGSVKRPKEWK